MSGKRSFDGCQLQRIGEVITKGLEQQEGRSQGTAYFVDTSPKGHVEIFFQVLLRKPPSNRTPSQGFISNYRIPDKHMVDF
jgi:hypothetical protein